MALPVNGDTTSDWLIDFSADENETSSSLTTPSQTAPKPTSGSIDLLANLEIGEPSSSRSASGPSSDYGGYPLSAGSPAMLHTSTAQSSVHADPTDPAWGGIKSTPLSSNNEFPDDNGKLGETGNSSNDSDDSEDEPDLVVKASREMTVSQKKRVDTAVFQEYLLNNPAALKEQTDGEGGKMTTNWLVKQAQNRAIIGNPRDYQMELFEIARKRNTIIVLDTGSGKTLIAMLLLKETIENEAESRAQGRRAKTAFFLVEKVALVDQHWSSLAANLPYGDKVGKYFGKVVEQWSHEYWKKQFEDKMVVVCTATILQKCLAHGFMRMADINLLIIDEAHHTKRNHPYARIVKDFYNPEPKESRPRILAMTASPVDTNESVEFAARRLEYLLQSQIATVSAGTLDVQLGRKDHKEEEAEYARLPLKVLTPLCRHIQTIAEDITIFNNHLDFANKAAREYGTWFSDRYWKLCFTEAELAWWKGKAERFESQKMMEYGGGDAVSLVERVSKVIDASPLIPLTRDSKGMSSKINCLLGILEKYFSTNTKHDHKCIVFVDQRNTAILLLEMFKECSQIQIPYLRPAVLVGTTSKAGGPSDMSYRESVVTIHRFRQSEINCLIASSVAEEGIDIPDCDIIVRFDPAISMIQYIQSKGRARHARSVFINMLEAGNYRHAGLLQDAQRNVVRLREFCSALPEDRRMDCQILRGGDRWETLMEEQHYTIDETGAKLTFSHSLSVLASFASSLQDPSGPQISPTYLVLECKENEFVAAVGLPEKSPIRGARGDRRASKLAARYSAAYRLCVELIKKGYIDNRLQSTLRKRLPAMRDARLAISSHKKDTYNMILKPNIWTRIGPVEKLYCTVLTLDRAAVMGRDSRPILLLTREPLPALPAVPLSFGEGRTTRITLQRLGTPLDLRGDNAEKMNLILGFTLRLFQDVFSKSFDAGSSDMPYFLAPSRFPHGHGFSQEVGVAEILDWDAAQMARDHDALVPGPNDDAGIFYQNRFVTDPFDGGNKLYTRHVRRDMHASDPVPEGVPPSRYKDWKKVEPTIANWSCSLWKSARSKKKWDLTLPVLEAEMISTRRNLLDDFEIDDDDNYNSNKPCFIILDTYQASPISTDVAAMALALPAVIHRLEDNLIALDACQKLGLNIRPNLALEAFTKDGENSGDHGDEQINFQGGMGNNYERLEFLGDCFLKMATTIALFTKVPNSDEFHLHVDRMVDLCNQNLFNHAVAEDRRLQEYVRSVKFNRRTWYPPNLTLKRGKAPKQQQSHALGDKAIADVCEAVIGAAYQTWVPSLAAAAAGRPDADGRSCLDEAVKAVTVVTKSKHHVMTSWAQYHAGYEVPEWQVADRGRHGALRDLVADRTGYRFEHVALLRSAFKHTSYMYEPSLPNYQRLEFLGDALLDMVCIDHLFRTYPEGDPQWLTEHKMAMVSNHFLACLCVELDLHNHLACLHGDVLAKKSAFVQSVKEAKELAIAEAKLSSSSSPATSNPPPLATGPPSVQYKKNFWTKTSNKDVPKCLSDMVEALIGAMFVDSGYDLSVVWAFFVRHVLPFFEDMSLYDDFAGRHPMTDLSLRLARRFGCRAWRVRALAVPPGVDEAGAAAVTATLTAAGILIHGRVVSCGRSQSGRHAKEAAARDAARWLDGLEGSREAFLRETGCDCKIVDGSGEGDLGDLAGHGTAI